MLAKSNGKEQLLPITVPRWMTAVEEGGGGWLVVWWLVAAWWMVAGR